MRGARGDVVLYAACAVLAAGLAVVTIYHGHRLWGVAAAVAYAGGALASLAARGRDDPRTRAVIAAAVFVLAALVPLVILVVQRVHGVPWSAQPEVDVVERMAALLLDTGSPYADVHALGRPAGFEDYTPYLPAMAVFGVPHALLPGGVTDARLVFAACAAALVALALRTARRPAHHRTTTDTPGQGGTSAAVPVRAVQLVAVLPATTLTLATGGDDLPVLALLLVVLAAAHARHRWLAALAGGLALGMKLTAVPVLLVVGVLLWVRDGRGTAVRFGAATLGLGAALVLPAALMTPHELVEHVIHFPAGLTGVDSPAASPLPGYLIASTGDAGRAVALGLLAVAALAVLAWVLRRPPRTAAAAAERAAAGLAAAMLLMPATRFGYLVYPLVLFGAALALRAFERSFAMRRMPPESATLDRGGTAPAVE
ncbi:MAG TPA: glycosyltransferase 87 family protein [Pseudonocardiaceae bacterium]